MTEALSDEFTGIRIGFYAYAQHLMPPVAVEARDNLAISLAPIHACRIHGPNNPMCPESNFPLWAWAMLVKQGLRNLLAGTVLVGLAWLIGSYTASDIASPGRLLLATILLLPGLSLVLHFGLLNVIAGLWRRLSSAVS